MTGGTRSGGETGSVSIKSHLLRRGQDSTPETPEKRDRASIRNSSRDQIGPERLFAAHPSFSWDELTRTAKASTGGTVAESVDSRESGTRIRRPTRGSNEKTGDRLFSADRTSSLRNGFRYRKSGRNRYNQPLECGDSSPLSLSLSSEFAFVTGKRLATVHRTDKKPRQRRRE